MDRKQLVETILVPPAGACRCACRGHCAAPVTVIWLFGVVSLVIGLFGGPTNTPGISWNTVSVGLASWAAAALWTWFTVKAADGNGCETARTQQEYRATGPRQRQLPRPLKPGR